MRASNHRSIASPSFIMTLLLLAASLLLVHSTDSIHQQQAHEQYHHRHLLALSSRRHGFHDSALIPLSQSASSSHTQLLQTLQFMWQHMYADPKLVDIPKNLAQDKLVPYVYTDYPAIKIFGDVGAIQDEAGKNLLAVVGDLPGKVYLAYGGFAGGYHAMIHFVFDTPIDFPLTVEKKLAWIRMHQNGPDGEIERTWPSGVPMPIFYETTFDRKYGHTAEGILKKNDYIHIGKSLTPNALNNMSNRGKSFFWNAQYNCATVAGEILFKAKLLTVRVAQNLVWMFYHSPLALDADKFPGKSSGEAFNAVFKPWFTDAEYAKIEFPTYSSAGGQTWVWKTITGYIAKDKQNP